MLCSGLYHPTCVDGVQHVLSRAEGSHDHAPTIISYIYFYYVPDIPNAMLTSASAHTILCDICSVHVLQLTDAHWTYEYGWGKTCSVTFTSDLLSFMCLHF